MSYHIARGFSLLETLLMMMLGMLIMLGLFTAYVSSQKSYDLQLFLQHQQDQALSAIAILKTNLHQAGFIGCAQLTNDFPLITYPAFVLNPKTALIGTSSTFSVRYMENSVAMVIENPMPTVLLTDNKKHFSKGEILMVTDCTRGEMFTVEAVHKMHDKQKILLTTPLHGRFAPGAEVGKVISKTFYLSRTGRLHKDGSPIKALYVEDGFHKHIALVDEVEDLKLSYIFSNYNPAEIIGVAIELTISGFLKPSIWFVFAKVTQRVLN